MLFAFVNMEPYGSENFKMLLLLQVLHFHKQFQFLDVCSVDTHQKLVGDY